jgi:putative chitinase
VTLQAEEHFFDTVRATVLGPSLNQDEVDGCKAILAAADGLPVSWAAYMLATAFHETAHTMQPIHENGGGTYFFRRYDMRGLHPDVARVLGNNQPGDGVKFHGRGYVQLTGRTNYARAQREIGVPLLDDPDLALQPPIAAQVMRRGMVEGWFTGKSLRDYLPRAGGFVQARRIINGLDRAELIASYARAFQAALVAGEWP